MVGNVVYGFVALVWILVMIGSFAGISNYVEKDLPLEKDKYKKAGGIIGVFICLSFLALLTWLLLKLPAWIF